MSTKTTLLLIITALVVVSGVLVFLFRADIQSAMGIKNNSLPVVQDFAGKSINIMADGKQVSIPPILSSDVLKRLKQEFTESAGMPLRVERKGNSLPFGIP